VKPCPHGLALGYCVVRSCPHWDGVRVTHDLKRSGPKRVHTNLTRKRVAR
jgi:hypothetical protein